MNSKKVTYGVQRMVLATAVASLLGSASLSAAAAAQPTNTAAAQAKQAALKAWQQSLRQIAPPAAGCFHASFPSLAWQKVECGKANITQPVPSRKIIHDLLNGAGQSPQKTNSLLGPAQLGQADTSTGDGNDYIAQTTSLIQWATGSFPAVTNVTSVNSSIAGGAGTNGSNQYSIQLNTNISTSSTPACNGAPPGTAGCRVWEQFGYESHGTYASLVIDNWLFGWGLSKQDIHTAENEQSSLGTPEIQNPLMVPASCPKNWMPQPEACVMTVSTFKVPLIPISDLASVSLTGFANLGGRDEALLIYNGEMYSVTEPASTLDIYSVWNQAEFNVLGGNEGTQANFNPGTSLTLNLQVDDGSKLAPTCLDSNSAATSESNNLTRGACTATGATPTQTATGSSLANPSIQFTESNGSLQ